MTPDKVFIVYDGNEAEISRVFDNLKAAEEWKTKGHEDGWLLEEETFIYELKVYQRVEE